MANTCNPARTAANDAARVHGTFSKEAYTARQLARRSEAVYVSRSEVARQYREMSDRWNAQR